MPQTPQDFGGPLFEDEIRLYDQYGIFPYGPGGIVYSDGYFLAEDQYGVFNLRSGSGGGGSGFVEPHADTHISGGTDEIDGDQLDVDFTPIAYSPTTDPPEVDDVNQLSAHLAGIDAYLDNLGQEKLDVDDHRTLRHLIHFIDDGPAGGFASGAYNETLPVADPFPTSIIWYTSVAKTAKIVEVTITRNSSKFPTTEEWKMYNVDGTTVLTTVTDAISYSGPFEISRTRTIA
ncbi:MAG: hypothetical protein ACWGQW_22310 [bacterium]